MGKRAVMKQEISWQKKRFAEKFREYIDVFRPLEDQELEEAKSRGPEYIKRLADNVTAGATIAAGRNAGQVYSTQELPQIHNFLKQEKLTNAAKTGASLDARMLATASAYEDKVDAMATGNQMRSFAHAQNIHGAKSRANAALEGLYRDEAEKQQRIQAGLNTAGMATYAMTKGGGAQKLKDWWQNRGKEGITINGQFQELAKPQVGFTWGDTSKLNVGKPLGFNAFTGDITGGGVIGYKLRPRIPKSFTESNPNAGWLDSSRGRGTA